MPTETTTESATPSVTESVTESDNESAPDPAAESATESTNESAADSTTESAAESATESLSKGGWSPVRYASAKGRALLQKVFREGGAARRAIELLERGDERLERSDHGVRDGTAPRAAADDRKVTDLRHCDNGDGSCGRDGSASDMGSSSIDSSSVAGSGTVRARSGAASEGTSESAVAVAAAAVEIPFATMEKGCAASVVDDCRNASEGEAGASEAASSGVSAGGGGGGSGGRKGAGKSRPGPGGGGGVARRGLTLPGGGDFAIWSRSKELFERRDRVVGGGSAAATAVPVVRRRQGKRRSGLEGAEERKEAVLGAVRWAWKVRGFGCSVKSVTLQLLR